MMLINCVRLLAAVVEEGTIVTPDIGGSASTDEFYRSHHQKVRLNNDKEFIRKYRTWVAWK